MKFSLSVFYLLWCMNLKHFTKQSLVVKNGYFLPTPQEKKSYQFKSWGWTFSLPLCQNKLAKMCHDKVPAVNTSR